MMRRGAPLAIGLSVALALTPTVAAAQAPQLLGCGTPVARHLEPAGVDTFEVFVAPGATVVVDVSDTSGTIGLLKLQDATDETCTGSLTLTHPGNTLIHVSDCLGTDSGDYTITANTVAQDAGNCGLPLPCGATPRVLSFSVAGEVDSHMFSGSAGDQVVLTASDVSGSIGFVRLRIFDPDGMLLAGADFCRSARVLTLQKTGTYTALASSCGFPKTGRYGIALQGSACPTGPDITYFGIARADSMPLSPTTYDGTGRPLYSLTAGSGIFVVLEARPGSSGLQVGQEAFNYNPHDPMVLPDLQVLVSRPLGNGSPAVCDKTPPNAGGVPRIAPPDFNDTQAVADAINDFGCRVNDGAGHPTGVTTENACTLFPDGEFHFVDATTTLQFCAPIAQPWSFPQGTTIVTARVRDTQGAVGAAREMVVRVGEDTQVSLVKDIASGPGSSNPSHLVRVSGNVLYFTADDGINGFELWRSNGSASGTTLVRDVRPGFATSSPDNLIEAALNAVLFFAADDGVHGTELWKTDGTDFGTGLVKDINPMLASSFPNSLITLNSNLFFAADDGSSGTELWTSDGSLDGTVRVKDINPGPAGSVPHDLATVNSTLFFAANDGTTGFELWKSNGTDDGTMLVADIRPGADGSSPQELTNVNGTLFFVADDGAHGAELWKSDGTENGTILVKDIAPGATGSAPANLTDVGGILYFAADDAMHGVELWRSDGTEDGTQLVADIRPDAGSSAPANLTDVQGTLFFAADDGTHGMELWKSDGTAGGTVLVRDINPGAAASTPTNLTNANGTLVFAATDGVSGVEPWKSNGTANGTSRVQDIAVGGGSSFPAFFTVVGSKVLFAADDGISGRELWQLPVSALLQRCPGDCNDDFQVTINELITGMTIALGTGSIDACPAIDFNGDGVATVDEVILAVNAALNGCSSP